MSERDATALAQMLFDQNQIGQKLSRHRVELPQNTMRRQQPVPTQMSPSPEVGKRPLSGPKFHIEPLPFKRKPKEDSPTESMAVETAEPESTKIIMLKSKRSPLFKGELAASCELSIEPLLQRTELWPNQQSEDSREMAFNDLYYKHRKLQLHYSVCQILLKVGLELNAQMQEMARLLVEKFSLFQCHLFLLPEETPHELICTASYGHEHEDVAALPVNCEFKPGKDSLIARAWQEKRDLLASGEKFNQYCVPIMHQNHLQGLIELYFAPTHTLSVEEQLTLKTISAQLSSYLEEYHKYRQTQQLAITDGLTRLYNHRYFQECFEQALHQAAARQDWIALILIDLDYFKQINDTYGHLQGDKVLHQVAQVIKRTVRNHDLVARYGGEEFAVLLQQSDAALTQKIAERIRENIAKEDIVGACEHPLRITASIGVVVVNSPLAHQREGLIAQADEALYEVKHNGRNGVKVVEPMPVNVSGQVTNLTQQTSEWSLLLYDQQEHLLQEWLRLVDNYAAPTVTQAALQLKAVYPQIIQAIAQRLSPPAPVLIVSQLLPKHLNQMLLQGQTGMSLIDLEITLLLLKEALSHVLKNQPQLTPDDRTQIEKVAIQVIDTLNEYLIGCFK